MELFENLKWETLKEEGITKEDLSLIDLDIAFTPVIPIRNGTPTEAVETIGGKYLLPDFPLFKYAISKEELTVMRYRYLVSTRISNTRLAKLLKLM